jgi:putative cardiolipin synthase
MTAVSAPARQLFSALFVGAALLFSGCATLPPGFEVPKTESSALAQPETTALGKRLAARAKQHPGMSGFRLLIDGADSFALRLQIAEKAEKTLDVQYFLLQQDDTGQLLLGALLDAADRGVRVRILLDDALGIDGGATIRPLAAHENIEIRVFNPFVTRQEFAFLRGLEYLLQVGKLDYRMHNKLFVGDNAVAVTGGRNIGDEYFQASEGREFGDFDLAVAGPMVQNLSRTFDLFWNDRLAIPVEAQPLGQPSAHDLEKARAALAGHRQKMAASSYYDNISRRDQLPDILSGKRPLIWAKAVLAYDSPDKASTVSGDEPGHLMWKRVASATENVKSELIIVSPYLGPGRSELELLRELRERGVRVRILTNSLASTDMPIVHAGYRNYRVPLLQIGVELYEVRKKLGEPETSRGPIKSASSGSFALHAKVFVFDRERVFVGSMNFDRRSLRINTELGLIIDSPQLAREVAARFDAITQPANSFQVVLAPGSSPDLPIIQWRGVDKGDYVALDTEPGVKPLKRSWIEALSLLPLDGLL